MKHKKHGNKSEHGDEAILPGSEEESLSTPMQKTSRTCCNILRKCNDALHWRWMPNWLNMCGSCILLATSILYTITTLEASDKTQGILDILGVDEGSGIRSIVDAMGIIVPCVLAFIVVVIVADLICSSVIARYLRDFGSNLMEKGFVLEMTLNPKHNETTCCGLTKAWMRKRPSTLIPSGLALLTVLVLLIIILLASLDAAWLVAASIVNVGAKSATRFWNYGADLIDETDTEFSKLYSDILDMSADALSDEDWDTLVAQYNLTEKEQQTLEKELRSDSSGLNGTSVDVCPTDFCLDLSLYEWIDSDECFCNPEEIEDIRNLSASAIDVLIISLVSTFFMSLGGSCIFASLTANSAELSLCMKVQKAITSHCNA